MQCIFSPLRYEKTNINIQYILLRYRFVKISIELPFLVPRKEIIGLYFLTSFGNIIIIIDTIFYSLKPRKILSGFIVQSFNSFTPSLILLQ